MPNGATGRASDRLQLGPHARLRKRVALEIEHVEAFRPRFSNERLVLAVPQGSSRGTVCPSTERIPLLARPDRRLGPARRTKRPVTFPTVPDERWAR